MSKGNKFLLAAATVWPILYFFIFIGAAFSMMIFSEGEAGWLWGLILPLHLLTMLLMFGLTAFYIVNVFRNDRIKNDMKALWAVVLFMGNFIAMPIYWYLYIWKDPSPDKAALVSIPALLGASAMPNQQSRDVTYAPPSQPPDWR
jgi:ABC-type polysaccharide/polyol phosphate export permease